MFEFHDVEQNTDSWLAMRGGKLTSSNMGKVMANFGKAFGDPAKKLAVNIAIEQITGQPISSDYSNDHMERGHEQEPLARMAYEDEHFCKVSNGGFFASDFVGCSPDGLVFGVGVIEIKSVIASVHYANVKRGGIDPAYKWQCIANLKFTGRDWLDFISYCPDFPAGKQLYTYRLYPAQVTEEYTMLETRIAEFKKLVDETRTTILNADYSVLDQQRAAA